jgi:hypothetical protein
MSFPAGKDRPALFSEMTFRPFSRAVRTSPAKARHLAQNYELSLQQGLQPVSPGIKLNSPGLINLNFSSSDSGFFIRNNNGGLLAEEKIADSLAGQPEANHD